MRNLMIASILSLFAVGGINCQPVSGKTGNTFEFNDLTFYSSSCNGTCPDITMNLSGFNKIQLIRTIYSRKGVIDTVNSGGFKGSLSERDYNKIVEMLSKINWEKLAFPDVQCCDLPVITILISYNNTSKRFKSMAPPLQIHELIKYLTEFSMNISLPRYDHPMDFEVYELPSEIKQ
jgi:hypothetical protein